MSVRPHPSKSKKEPGRWWHVDIGHGANRSRIVFQGSYTEAVEFHRALAQTPVISTTAATVAPKISDLVLPFLEWYKNEASPRTIRDYHFSINLYFVPLLGTLRTNQLTLQLFLQFRDRLLGEGLKQVTINKHLNYLSSMFKWAVSQGLCQKLGFELPRFSKKLTGSPPRKALTARQVDAIYAHLEPEYRIPFLLMADHGLRQEEAMNVQIEDVDEGRKTIRVFGKGSKYRMVPFLSDRFEEEVVKVLDKRLSCPLCLNERTGKALVTIWKPLKRATAAAGILRPVNHHLLRHTAATLFAESGMNPHALQRILGHSSIETTNRIYTHVSRDFVGDEARILRERRGV